MRSARAAVIFIAVMAALWAAAGPLWAENFIWQISSKKGGQAYIMGSIHLAHKGLYPLRAPIMNAFEKSDALVVEIDMEAIPPETMSRFLLEHGLSKDKRPLPERLSEETEKLLMSGDYYRGYMASLTPWMAALNIQMEAMLDYGFESQYGLDNYFAGLARSKGMPIVSLETMGDQMGMLTDMSDHEADLFLKATLVEMDDLPKTMRAFLDTWNSGDAAGFAEVFFKEYDKYPELIPLLDKIIFRRNEEMAAKISRLIDKKAMHFIVVGAGHLVGDRSILAHLAAKGYSITQL